MKYNGEKHNRRSIRLSGYDYAQSGAYFVTVCTQKRPCLFGSIMNGEMQLNDAGRIVQEVWGELPARFSQVGRDSFVVMPNHIRQYILDNPARWDFDRENPAATAVEPDFTFEGAINRADRRRDSPRSWR